MRPSVSPEPSEPLAPIPPPQEQYEYRDAVTEFLICLYVDYDFEGAQQKLAECEVVLENDFFLTALKVGPATEWFSSFKPRTFALGASAWDFRSTSAPGGFYTLNTGAGIHKHVVPKQYTKARHSKCLCCCMSMWAPQISHF